MIYKCTVQYDGSKYSGWQKQPGLSTIQQSIEEALSIIHKEAIQIHGSGRTDKGVHAYGQVFHFESDLNMDADAFHRALNALLPHSIHITQICEIPNFHARFDAVSKCYEYYINTGDVDVFQYDYQYQYGKALDLKKMKDAAQVFIGEHDFTSFNATELAIIENQVRVIELFDVEKFGNIIKLTIQGDGFLRYMVRMLVAALIEVGSGRLNHQDLETFLLAKDKTVFPKNVPACGLYLKEVTYKINE